MKDRERGGRFARKKSMDETARLSVERLQGAGRKYKAVSAAVVMFACIFGSMKLAIFAITTVAIPVIFLAIAGQTMWVPEAPSASV